jgi:DNA-binding transcriptional LysR family regulator
MRLDIESLRTFRAVVETGSVTQAAGQLSLTQSAVSWKMKRLEERLGSPLLIRDGRNVTLTELGTELLAHAELIVAAHDDAVDSLQRSQLEGTVHLGINDELDANDVAGLLGRFRRRHPLVRLHVRMSTSDALARLLRSGDLDVALLQTFQPNENDRVLWTEELSWVAAASFVVPDGDALPVVTFGPDSSYRTLALDELKAAGIDHFVMFESETSAGVRGAVAGGLGVAVLNERGIDDECVPWSIDALDEALPTASFVVRVNRRSRATAVRTLVDDIVEVLA